MSYLDAVLDDIKRNLKMRLYDYAASGTVEFPAGEADALEVASELAEILDRIEEYLDNRADAEGNGPADYKPNEEMRLLNALRDARERDK